MVKTQRPHRLRARTSLEKKAFVLERLAELADLAVPRVLGYGNESNVEYIVMTRIAGVAVDNVEIEGPARAGLLGDLGDTLRRVHEADQAAMEASPLITGDNSGADLRERIAAGFDALIPAVASDADGSLAGIDLRELAEEYLAALPTDFRPVTLHSNPGPVHCFADTPSGRFTGLIDFGDAYRSHPALDLRPWSSPDDSRHLLAGYCRRGPLAEGFEAVRRCGIVLSELRLVARGGCDERTAVRTIRSLADDDA